MTIYGCCADCERLKKVLGKVLGRAVVLWHNHIIAMIQKWTHSDPIERGVSRLKTLFSTKGPLFDPLKHRDLLGSHFLRLDQKTIIDLDKTFLLKLSLTNSIVLIVFF